jgi:hypothetical protein
MVIAVKVYTLIECRIEVCFTVSSVSHHDCLDSFPIPSLSWLVWRMVWCHSHLDWHISKQIQCPSSSKTQFYGHFMILRFTCSSLCYNYSWVAVLWTFFCIFCFQLLRGLNGTLFIEFWGLHPFIFLCVFTQTAIWWNCKCNTPLVWVVSAKFLHYYWIHTFLCLLVITSPVSVFPSRDKISVSQISSSLLFIWYCYVHSES